MPNRYKRMPWGANHGCEQPCRMVIYDTETHSIPHSSVRGKDVHRLRLGVAHLLTRKGQVWTRRIQKLFTTADAFWSFVYSSCRPREPLWIYSHNQSFDWTIVDGFSQLISRRIRIIDEGKTYKCSRTGCIEKAKPFMGVLAVDGLPFIVVGRTDYGTVKIVDTLNYLPYSLAKLAKWVGLAKVELPHNEAPADEWAKRCIRDTEILEAVVLRMLKMWSDKHLGNWQMTTATLAYSSFRHLTPRSGLVAHGDDEGTDENQADDSIIQDHRPLTLGEVARVERRSYYGGRVAIDYVGKVSPNGRWVYHDHGASVTEVRRCETGPVTVYDVNGLYGYVMAQNEYPIELLETVRHPTIRLLQQAVERFPSIADVTLRAESDDYPYRTAHRVVYPTGTFATSLAGPELKRAVQAGIVLAVSNLCVYHAGRPFGNYVNYWWAVRAEAIVQGDDITAKLAKAMITALSGKLGQRKPVWRTRRDIPPVRPWGGFIATDPETQRMVKCRAVGRVVQSTQTRRDCSHTVCAVAACVTAYGRDYMRRLKSSLPPRSFLYSDTDSLFLLPHGAAVIEDRFEVDHITLGGLKRVGQYDNASIYGRKCYDLDSRLTAAGLHGEAKVVGERAFEYTAFEGQQSILARGGQPEIQTWQQGWQLPTHVPAVRILPDGWTLPIRLNDTNIPESSQLEEDTI